MKKLIIAVALGLAAVGAGAGPCGRGCGPCGPGPGCRPCPPPHYHHHGDFWGRGGRNFWPGFVGGVIGGALARTVVEPAPVVVTQPVVTQPVVVQQPVVVTQPTVVTTPVVTTPATTVQNVWVEGCYVDQTQANGTVVRVWQPGHYEQRSILVR